MMRGYLQALLVGPRMVTHAVLLTGVFTASSR